MASNEEQGRKAAARFRDSNGLGTAPIHDLIPVIEKATQCDVLVIADVDENEHGLTVRDPHSNTVFIGVAATRHPMRQRSTLAHELAHFLFDDFGAVVTVDRSPEEIRADAFARHLLVPQEGLKHLFPHPTANPERMLSDVVQWFWVSPAIAGIAMEEAKLIDQQTRASLQHWSTPKLATRFGWDDQYKSLQLASNQKRAPQKLLERTIRGYKAGVISEQTIATLKQEKAEEVLQVLESANITPAIMEVEESDWVTAEFLQSMEDGGDD